MPWTHHPPPLAALALAGLAALALAPRPAGAEDAKPVLVFAAASLTTAFNAIGAEWQKATGKTVAFSYAASSALARQMESGAPADVFVSADLRWMDWSAEKKLIKDDTRETLLGNALVLIAPLELDLRPQDRQGLPAGQGDRRFAPGHRRHPRRAGRQLRQAGADQSRGVGRGRAQDRRRRERARRARPWSPAASPPSASSMPPTPRPSPR